MKENVMKKRWARKDKLAAGFFLVCAAMTAYYLLMGYGAYLDSDMASELVLSSHLAEVGAPVSGAWYYSTEIRLLNTQLVFTPLMALFPDDWRLVRTLGCLILMGLLAAASLFAARAFGAKRRYALLFAGMNISVCSPLYSQNVVIGAYYVPHAALTMALLGLFARWQRGRKQLTGALVLALAFGLGASSVRYLAVALAPLLCACLWSYTFPMGDETLPRSHAQRCALALGAGAAVMGLAGYIACRAALGGVLHYAFDYYGSMGYADWQSTDLFGQLQTVLGGLLTGMGFEGKVPLIGGQGILNALTLLMLFVGGLLLWRCARTLCADEASTPGRTALIALVFALGLSLAMFVLLRSVYFDRYWLPVMMLGAPVMALCLTRERNVVFRRLAALLFAGTVLLTSASCMVYSMRGPQVAREMRMEAVDEARRLGLDKGYATFWNANIVTELSNGEIEMTALEEVTDERGRRLHLRPWLESEAELVLDRPDEPVFLLVGNWEEEGLEAFLAKAGAQRHALDGWINLYVIPTQRILFEAMGEISTQQGDI